MEIKKIGRLYLLFQFSIFSTLLLSSSLVRAQCCSVRPACQPVVKCVYKCRVPCPKRRVTCPKRRVIRECLVAPYACDIPTGRESMAEYEWIDP